MNKLLITGMSIAMVCIIAFTGYLLLRQPQTNPSSVLGIALPTSAANVQIDVQPHFIEGYDAYVRFDIAPEDLQDFLADPAFQPTRRTDDPLSVFWNSIRNSTPMEQVASASRPTWWQPEQGDRFVTAYRSRGADSRSGGPDSSWYIIDKSNPERYTIYVFATEI